MNMCVCVCVCVCAWPCVCVSAVRSPLALQDCKSFYNAEHSLVRAGKGMMGEDGNSLEEKDDEMDQR